MTSAQYGQLAVEPVNPALLSPRIGQDDMGGTAQHRRLEMVRAHQQLMASVPQGNPWHAFIGGLTQPDDMRGAPFQEMIKKGEASMAMPNVIAKNMRERARHFQTVAPGANGPLDFESEFNNIVKSGGALAKAQLDVGTTQNFASITGGQSLGYVSLDTKIARATVRPDSFTLYQALPKSAAFQVVDYWAYIDDPGSSLPGSAFSGFSNVASGSLGTAAGIYALKSVNLKLALDGRAVTTALLSQNNFVDVVTQENANAALTVLQSMNWTCYWGNSTLFPNQPAGVYNLVPTTNIFSFQTFYANNAALQGWSISQALYNMIYEVAAQVTAWGRFGRITHAFMTPICNGSLQGLVTTTLNNIVTAVSREQRQTPGIVVDGDLQGMRTRMGVIQFPLDLTITARDIPAAGQVRGDGTYPIITTVSTPSSVTVAVSGAAATASQWGVSNGAYVSGVTSTNGYYYAAAATDINMNETALAFSAVASGITATGAFVVTITPPDSTAYAFRVYRSGLGGYGGSNNSPTAFRYVGTVLASGASAVTFADLNAYLPGSETIFLLDLHEADQAFDYRFLLPLSRIDLFAGALYMPWAVATIAAPRVRIPRFHAVITNYIPDSPVWNPLGKNS